MSFLSVSEKAWEIVKEVAYPGYEALLPFLKAVETGYFPYTPYWHGIAQLRKACELIFERAGKIVLIVIIRWRNIVGDGLRRWG